MKKVEEGKQKREEDMKNRQLELMKENKQNQVFNSKKYKDIQQSYVTERYRDSIKKKDLLQNMNINKEYGKKILDFNSIK